MRLQQKVYGFQLDGGAKPSKTLLTSKVLVNGNESDLLISNLFSGIKKEKNNSIKGYSVLEFLDEHGNISVNGKVYNIKFKSGEEVFTLASVSDPTDFILSDKILNETEEKEIEQKIESSAPVEIPTQPQEEKTEEEIPKAGVEESIYENADYEQEKVDLHEQGYVEFNTEPKSNNRLLYKDEFDFVVIEITKKDYEILKQQKVDINTENKTFKFHD